MLAHCGKFLPPAKTPKQVLIVADLPKSDRGKVLRDKLREDWIARRRCRRSVVFVSPKTNSLRSSPRKRGPSTPDAE